MTVEVERGWRRGGVGWRCHRLVSLDDTSLCYRVPVWLTCE